MQYQVMTKNSIGLLIAIFLLSVMTTGRAHDGGGVTMDIENQSRTFTGVATVICSDDGTGTPAKLVAQVRDNSPPMPGLLVNLQLFKGNKAINITDTVSGDEHFSPLIALHGGPGTYFMIVNKTDVGARNFDLIWHCMTEDNVHTGIETSVSQFN